MDYELEKTVQFTNESEYKGLYDWCLKELNGIDNKKSQDLIPWNWSFSFTASSLRVVRGIEIKEATDEDVSEINESISILGALNSGYCSDGVNLKDDSAFYMFGTDRLIKEFDLKILKADSDKNEKCHIWGCPAYKYEIDFKNDIADDAVVVYLHLKEERFNEIIRLISSKQLDFAFIRMSRVDGFYSEWSPLISASKVKVLTNFHDIENIDESKVDIPKLGNVGEFSINFHSMAVLDIKPNLEPRDFYRQFDDELIDERSNWISKLTGQTELTRTSDLSESARMSSYLKAIDNLRLPLWFIVILLLILLIK